MANSNTLLALAYIRESENPLIVFCNLILYCLSLSTTQTLRHDQLKNKMDDNFGIKVPNHVINNCIRYLIKEKTISKIENGAGYKLIQTRFNVNEFENKKKILLNSENVLIKELVNFVKERFNINWTEKDAYNNLSELMLSDEFMQKVVEEKIKEAEDEKDRYIHDTWYVKKYIEHLMKNKNSLSYNYFFDVFNGILVLNGLIQTGDFNQEKEQKFRGTNFYFDTKLLLRVLGFSLPYYTETTKELVQLITKEYEGKICVLSHVLDEIKHAIRLAEKDMLKKGYIDNFEFDYFQKLNKYTYDDFRIARDSIESRLQNEFGFRIVNDIDLNAKKTIDTRINTGDLVDYISKNNPFWNKSAIENDVKSILIINIERNSDYTVKFGGKKKLPIFVTSNSKLVHDIRQFTINTLEIKNIEFPWSINKLPLITDYDLTCRLWLTSNNKEIISLTLAKSAYLYQQSDALFYERLRNTYNEIKQKHRYNIIDLDYERFEKFKEIIIEKTNGDLEEIDDTVVATTFDELAERKSIDKDLKIESLLNEKKENNKANNELKKFI